MTKNSAFKLALAACLLGVGSLASAADTYNGVQLHAVGEAPAFPAFDPEQNVASRMLDDGNAPDATADDSIWTTEVNFAAGTGFPAWKMGSWDGAPGGAKWGEESDGNARYDASIDASVTPVTFLYKDANFVDADPDWQPDNDYAYTSNGFNVASYLAGGTVHIFGSFINEITGGADWNAGDQSLTLVDDGSDPNDTAADGIYTRTITNFSVVGGKAFKILVGGSTAVEFASNGVGGNDHTFSILAGDIGNNVIIELRDTDGKIRITKATPPPPAGWYALGPWGGTFDNTTEVTPYADGYEGTFTVATPGYYRVQFVDSDGSGTLTNYPAGADNGYPFLTTTPNQQVRVNLHTSVLADSGFQPDRNIVFSDPDSRLDLGVVGARLQFIGFLSVYGTSLSGAASDWDTAATGAEATETAPGSEIFQLTTPVVAGFGGPTNFQVKGIWNSPDISPALGDVWHAQFGGTGSDRSGGIHQGSNSNATAPQVPFADGDEWTFVVDAATGRAGRVPAASVVAPLRPSRVNVPVGTNVQGWEMFE